MDFSLLSLNESLLIFISFFTSMFTTVFGVGGGVLLLTVMPGLVPDQSVIPIHGAVQLVSNGSRFGFGYKAVSWPLLKQYVPGALIGSLLGVFLLSFLEPVYIPVFMGTFILLMIWLPEKCLRVSIKHFLVFSISHSFISAIAGAAGPVAGAFLSRLNLTRDSLVTTLAGIMLISHTLKVLLFGFMGFDFKEYAALVVYMMISVTIGSLIGTKVRSYVPEFSFKKGFRLFITLLAIRMLVMPFF